MKIQDIDGERNQAGFTAEFDDNRFCFWLDHKFPSLNQTIAAAKKHWAQYAKMKKDETNFVASVIKMYDRWKTSQVPMFDHVDIELYFYEKKKGKLRDWDNIAFAQKFILDGMVAAGVIKDDSPLYVNSVFACVRYADAPTSVYVAINGFRNH